MNALEQLVSEACADGAVTEVIRPAAILPELAAWIPSVVFGVVGTILLARVRT